MDEWYTRGNKKQETHSLHFTAGYYRRMGEFLYVIRLTTYYKRGWKLKDLIIIRQNKENNNFCFVMKNRRQGN